MSSIGLVPIYFSNQLALLEPLAALLERTFHLPVRILDLWFNPELSFDSSRGQYNSTILLSQLLGPQHEVPDKVLGITSFDLFIPVLTYVFGEAQLNGRVAVVSTCRLRNEAYGIESNEALLMARLEKESVHELGHTFGLVHCIDQRCVMYSSTYVEQIDLKSCDFCSDCLNRIHSP